MLQTALYVRAVSEYMGSEKLMAIPKFKEIGERARTQTHIHCCKNPFSKKSGSEEPRGRTGIKMQT